MSTKVPCKNCIALPACKGREYKDLLSKCSKVSNYIFDGSIGFHPCIVRASKILNIIYGNEENKNGNPM